MSDHSIPTAHCKLKLMLSLPLFAVLQVVRQVQSMGHHLPMTMLIDMIKGSRNRGLKAKNLEGKSPWGIGKNLKMSKEEVNVVIKKMAQLVRTGTSPSCVCSNIYSMSFNHLSLLHSCAAYPEGADKSPQRTCRCDMHLGYQRSEGCRAGCRHPEGGSEPARQAKKCPTHCER